MTDETRRAGGDSRSPSRVAPDGPVRSAALSGAWAKPLQARVKHFFPDGRTAALCGAYLTRDVKPSQFGADPLVRCCPTCVRKLGYFDA